MYMNGFLLRVLLCIAAFSIGLLWSTFAWNEHAYHHGANITLYPAGIYQWGNTATINMSLKNHGGTLPRGSTVEISCFSRDTGHLLWSRVVNVGGLWSNTSRATSVTVPKSYAYEHPTCSVTGWWTSNAVDRNGIPGKSTPPPPPVVRQPTCHTGYYDAVRRACVHPPRKKPDPITCPRGSYMTAHGCRKYIHPKPQPKPDPKPRCPHGTRWNGWDCEQKPTPLPRIPTPHPKPTPCPWNDCDFVPLPIVVPSPDPSPNPCPGKRCPIYPDPSPVPRLPTPDPVDGGCAGGRCPLSTSTSKTSYTTTRTPSSYTFKNRYTTPKNKITTRSISYTRKNTHTRWSSAFR